MRKVLALALGLVVLALASPVAAQTVEPAIGMYALEAGVLGTSSGTTCLNGGNPWGFSFAYLYYSGSAATSTAYMTSNAGFQGYGPSPGHPVTVTLSKAPSSGIAAWNGWMTWNLNPWTMSLPKVTAKFSLTASIVDNNAFVFTMTFNTPFAAGISPPSCTKVVAYTAFKM